MEQEIKKLLMILLPLCPKGYGDFIYHGFFCDDECDNVLCFHMMGQTGFLPVSQLVEQKKISPVYLHNAFENMAEICRKYLGTLPEEERWSGLTIRCDCNLNFQINYEYDPTNQSLNSQWVQKYLK